MRGAIHAANVTTASDEDSAARILKANSYLLSKTNREREVRFLNIFSDR